MPNIVHEILNGFGDWDLSGWQAWFVMTGSSKKAVHYEHRVSTIAIESRNITELTTRVGTKVG